MAPIIGNRVMEIGPSSRSATLERVHLSAHMKLIATSRTRSVRDAAGGGWSIRESRGEPACTAPLVRIVELSKRCLGKEIVLKYLTQCIRTSPTHDSAAVLGGPSASWRLLRTNSAHIHATVISLLSFLKERRLVTGLHTAFLHQRYPHPHQRRK